MELDELIIVLEKGLQAAYDFKTDGEDPKKDETFAYSMPETIAAIADFKSRFISE